MKHISKTALLFGALAILASTVMTQAKSAGFKAEPTKAIGPPASTEVNPTKIMGRPVQGKLSSAPLQRGIVSAEHSRSARLSKLKKELDEKWQNFVDCTRKGIKCPQEKAISKILSSIIEEINTSKDIPKLNIPVTTGKRRPRKY